MDKAGNDMKSAIENCNLQSIRELRVFLPTDSIYLLIKNFGGCTIYLPKIEQLIKSARNDRIIEEYQSGASMLSLSRKYALTERQIRSIIKS